MAKKSGPQDKMPAHKMPGGHMMPGMPMKNKDMPMQGGMTKGGKKK